MELRANRLSNFPFHRKSIYLVLVSRRMWLTSSSFLLRNTSSSVRGGTISNLGVCSNLSGWTYLLLSQGSLCSRNYERSGLQIHYLFEHPVLLRLSRRAIMAVSVHRPRTVFFPAHISPLYVMSSTGYNGHYLKDEAVRGWS